MTSTLSPLQSNAISEAATLLAAAFDDEPVFLVTLPDAADRAECLLALFAADLANALRHGGVYRLDHPEHGLVGIAYWTRQPEPERPNTEMAELGFTAVFARWGAQLGPLGDIESGSLRYLSALFPTWRYLAGIGISPDQQGHGYGSILINAVIAEAWAADQPLGLATDRAINLPFYERAGFRVVHEDHDNSLGVPFWTMAMTYNTPAISGKDE